jgi:hypothetical protein
MVPVWAFFPEARVTDGKDCPGGRILELTSAREEVEKKVWMLLASAVVVGLEDGLSCLLFQTVLW